MSNQKTSVLGRAQLYNKVSLNAFDLSHRNVFSSSVGELLPVGALEMLPNEKATIKPNWFSRAQALVSDSFGRLTENVQSFFVPYTSLWRFAAQSMLSSIAVNLNGESDSRISVSPAVQAARGTKLPYFLLSDLYAWCGIYELLFYRLSAVLGGTVSVSGSMKTTCLGKDTFNRSISSARLFSYLGYGSFKEILNPALRQEKGFRWDESDPLRGEVRIYPLTQNGMQQLDDLLNCLYEDDKEVCAFRLLAYHKIYNDFYRNDVWTGYNARNCNIDYVLPSSPHVLGSSYFTGDGLLGLYRKLKTNLDKQTTVGTVLKAFNDTISASSYYNFFFRGGASSVFDLEVSNFELDYVNGILPSPQYGDASRVNISTTANPTTDAAVSVKQGNGSVVIGAQSAYSPGTLADDKRLGFSIKDLRVASSLQKFREIAASHDNDYSSQVLAHFGVAPQDDIYRTYFVGGSTSVMQVDTQVNQNLAGENSAVRGGIANAQGGYSCTYKSNTYGVLLSLYRIVPVIDYGNDGLCEQVATTRIDSLPIPEMDSNGFVAQRAFRATDYVYQSPEDSSEYAVQDGVYGYSVPYLDYKVAKDVTNGDICYTLNTKVVGRSSVGVFNNPRPGSSSDSGPFEDMENYFLCVPQSCDSIFVNNNHSLISDDQFYTNMQMNVSIVRPLSVHGLPFAN